MIWLHLLEIYIYIFFYILKYIHTVNCNLCPCIEVHLSVMFFCRSGIWSAQGAHGVSSCPRMPTTKALTAKRLMVSAKWKPHSRGEKQPKHTKAWPSMALVRGPKHTGEHTQVCAFMIHPWSMHAKRIATLTWGNQDICNLSLLQEFILSSINSTCLFK